MLGDSMILGLLLFECWEGVVPLREGMLDGMCEHCQELEGVVSNSGCQLAYTGIPDWGKQTNPNDLSIPTLYSITINPRELSSGGDLSGTSAPLLVSREYNLIDAHDVW